MESKELERRSWNEDNDTSSFQWYINHLRTLQSRKLHRLIDISHAAFRPVNLPSFGNASTHNAGPHSSLWKLSFARYRFWRMEHRKNASNTKNFSWIKNYSAINKIYWQNILDNQISRSGNKRVMMTNIVIFYMYFFILSISRENKDYLDTRIICALYPCVKTILLD